VHTFVIPVMGTGHSIDTPIRVAPYGIASVISLVDDMMIEQVRRHYAEKFGLPYESIPRNAEDGRARRISAYLDTVLEIVRTKMEEIRALPFFEENDKQKYFEMLPDVSPLRRAYDALLEMGAGPERDRHAESLSREMKPGSIDVNIMVKLDRVNFDATGVPLSEDYNDDKAALRGFANSQVASAVVFSAGINRSLYEYTARFRDFYRDATGEMKKRIIIKVSDFRSAMIQGKYLARKGLEVSEFRIESGLNCGGHAFATTGQLLPTLLHEFREKRDQLVSELRPMVLSFYRGMGWEYPESALEERPVLTVQGGIGTSGEARRLRENFGMDLTGWGSPFLLVPEATCVDDPTREMVRAARKEDLFLSDVSPLGVPFNNLRNTGSERAKLARLEKGKPGSPCPKGYVSFNTEFGEKPICLSSHEYQKAKLTQIEMLDAPDAEKDRQRAVVTDRSCLCHHLGNGALIALGIVRERDAPQAICPGPNVAWFNGIYSLRQMVDHIYGRGPSLVPVERPHMFANELVLYVDYFERLATRCTFAPKEIQFIRGFRDAIEQGMADCLDVAVQSPYLDENLASIAPCVEEQRPRLAALAQRFEESVAAAV
jgi:hypothetical protein